MIHNLNFKSFLKPLDFDLEITLVETHFFPRLIDHAERINTRVEHEFAQKRENQLFDFFRRKNHFDRLRSVDIQTTFDQIVPFGEICQPSSFSSTSS